MKIAVLMSAYNGEKYISQQIDSILNQNGDFQLDLIVRDDGSTDNTINILKNYEQEGKLKWYSGENLKPAKSFIQLIIDNKGYDYYAFSDQDDYWESSKLIESVKRIENINTPCICYSNAELVDENLKSLGRNLYKKEPDTSMYTIMCAANVIGCTMVFNNKLADFIREGGIPNVIVMHDSYLARVCSSIDGKVIYLNHVYTKYRQHGSNALGIKNTKKEKVLLLCKDIMKKGKITLDEQSKEILLRYSKHMPLKNKKWMEKVANYRKNLITRFALAFSRKPKYTSKSLALKFRLSILFGNR